MFNKKLLGATKLSSKIRYSLLIFATFSQLILADEKINNPYNLPPSKLQMALCERQALSLHAGAIMQERVFHQQDGSWIRYDIQANDHSEWSVLCDLTTGKIIREQRRIDDKF